MKVRLLVIGRTKEAYAVEGVNHFAERVRRVLPFEIVELPDEKTKGPGQKDREAERLLAALKADDFAVALDEHGKSLRSVEFARFVESRMNAGTRSLSFLIGGPDGHGDAVLKQAGLVLSLSPMTFPHDLARVIFTEQLYRAVSILRHEPYHHE